MTEKEHFRVSFDCRQEVTIIRRLQETGEITQFGGWKDE